MCSGRGILIADNVLRLPDNSPLRQHITRGSYSVRPYHTRKKSKCKSLFLYFGKFLSNKPPKYGNGENFC